MEDTKVIKLQCKVTTVVPWQCQDVSPDIFQNQHLPGKPTHPSQRAPWRRNAFLPPQVGWKRKWYFPSLHDAAGIFPEADMGQCNWYGMFWNIIKCSQEMQPTDTRTLHVLPLLLKTESDNHVKNFYSTHTISLSLATGLLILHLL